MACAIASELAHNNNEVILGNQGLVKATPTPQKAVVKDQDYRALGYKNTTRKQLSVVWIPGARPGHDITRLPQHTWKQHIRQTRQHGGQPTYVTPPPLPP